MPQLSKWRTANGKCRELGSTSIMVGREHLGGKVSELLGSPLSYTGMDLTLNIVLKTLRTELWVRNHLGCRPATR